MITPHALSSMMLLRFFFRWTTPLLWRGYDWCFLRCGFLLCSSFCCWFSRRCGTRFAHGLRFRFLLPEMLNNAISKPARMVSIMFANNEIGSIQPIKELCKIAHSEGAIFHTDAVQAVGHIDINVKDLDVDMLSASAHKFNGPKGVGFLFVKKGTPIAPYIHGGSQEHNMRAGTENIAAIVGMSIALRVEDNGFIILSDYGRFRKSRAANVEVHGGASLEEIVVPVITLTLRKQAGVQIVVLHPDDIFADRHDGTTIQLYISDVESVGGVHIVVDDKNYNGETEDGSHFTFKLEDIKRAKAKPYNADVFDGSDLIGTISFRIKGKTATIKEDFDFGNEF